MDLIYLVVIVIFFTITWALLRLCEQLMEGQA